MCQTAQLRAQGVHNDIVHFAPAKAVAVLQILNSRGKRQRRGHGKKAGKPAPAQNEGQCQADGDEEEHIHQHGAVEFRLILRRLKAVERNEDGLAGLLSSCVDGHVKDRGCRARKEEKIPQPPAQAVLLPEAQIPPQEDQKEHPEQNPLQRLLIDK